LNEIYYIQACRNKPISKNALLLPLAQRNVATCGSAINKLYGITAQQSAVIQCPMMGWLRRVRVLRQAGLRHAETLAL
jgi:hypothetical protein